MCVRACVRLRVCDLETLTLRRSGPDMGCCVREEEGEGEGEEEEEEEEKEKKK
jgi:hypothetical protein